MQFNQRIVTAREVVGAIADEKSHELFGIIAAGENNNLIDGGNMTRNELNTSMIPTKTMASNVTSFLFTNSPFNVLSLDKIRIEINCKSDSFLICRFGMMPSCCPDPIVTT